jgi:succinate-semialdehyde dehydrogenase / glutarate-semialdehyde dehydrogenase
MTYIKSINPATLKVIGKTRAATEKDIQQAVIKAKKAFPAWKHLGIEKRSKILSKLIRLLENNQPLAKLISQEMGKPIKDAEDEIVFALDGMRNQLKIAKNVLKPRVVDKETSVLHDPVGVIAAITPWNFPVLMPSEICTSALLAGNCILLKPSESTTLAGVELAKLIWKAGVPKEVFQILPGADDVGRALVKSNLNMVAFVGSRGAGKSIMRNSADKLHRVMLELGGKDPMIVCKDADLKKAARAAVLGAFRNTGQVCCSVERVYVVKEAAKEFIQEVVNFTKKVKVNSKLPALLNLGPLVNKQQYDHFVSHLKDAKNKGAKILIGGKSIPGKGYFYPPTVLVNVNEKMKIISEETFGPALPIQIVNNAEEGIRKANNTPFGLTSSIWTKDKKRFAEYISRLEAGSVCINETGGGGEETPWGGVKESGMGRLGSVEGLLQFTQTKVVVIRK